MSNHDVECPGCLGDCRNMACSCHSEGSGAMETPTGFEPQATGEDLASRSIRVPSANLDNVVRIVRRLELFACVCHELPLLAKGDEDFCAVHPMVGQILEEIRTVREQLGKLQGPQTPEGSTPSSSAIPAVCHRCGIYVGERDALGEVCTTCYAAYTSQG